MAVLTAGLAAAPTWGGGGSGFCLLLLCFSWLPYFCLAQLGLCMLGLSSPLFVLLTTFLLSLMAAKKTTRVHGQLGSSMVILLSLSNLLRIRVFGRMRVQLGQWQTQ
uniref:Uncharacterized protein n=1 Tax=Opuntia streptacantha TaxID=393608 RepID=A0A7C9AKQ6_OPUST